MNDLLFKFDGETLKIRKSTYQNNGASAVFVECEDGEPYAILSCNLEAKPANGCFWLKDWSENEPIAKALLKSGVIELTGRAVSSGFVLVKEARFR